MGRRYGDRFIAVADQGEWRMSPGATACASNASTPVTPQASGIWAERNDELKVDLAALHVSEGGPASAR